jgi:hypothetical protein
MSLLIVFFLLPLLTVLLGLLIEIILGLGQFSYWMGFIGSVFVCGTILPYRGPLKELSFDKSQNLSKNEFESLKIQQKNWEYQKANKKKKVVQENLLKANEKFYKSGNRNSFLGHPLICRSWTDNNNQLFYHKNLMGEKKNTIEKLTKNTKLCKDCFPNKIM